MMLKMNMAGFKKAVSRFTRNEQGATAMEYSLIAALISLALLGFFGQAATSMGNAFSDVASSYDEATG